MMMRRCRLKDCVAHQAPTHNAKHFVCVSLIDCFRDFFLFRLQRIEFVCLIFFFFILLAPLQLLAVQTSSGSVAEQKKQQQS